MKTVTEIGSALIMKQFHRMIEFQILQVGHACRSPRKLQMVYYIYIQKFPCSTNTRFVETLQAPKDFKNHWAAAVVNVNSGTLRFENPTMKNLQLNRGRFSEGGRMAFEYVTRWWFQHFFLFSSLEK